MRMSMAGRKMKVSAVMIILLFVGLCAVIVFSQTGVQTISPHTYVVLKAEFHAHTKCSGGNYTPTELVCIYKNASYDVLAITDHNTMAGCTEAQIAGEANDMVIIRGEELSCVLKGGYVTHIVALFLNSEIPCKTWYSTDQTPYFFTQIHNQGALGIVAHAWESWSYWKRYTGTTWIDGWEWKSTKNMDWVYRTNYIYLYDHDFHYSIDIKTRYTLLLAHNKTEAAVRDALQERRIVVYHYGKYYGTPAMLSLLIQNEDLICIQKS